MNDTLPRPDTSTYVPPATSAATSDGKTKKQYPTLVRPRDGRKIGGVCAGVADKYGWSRTTVRVLTLLSVLLPGPQVIAYIVMWFVLPDEADNQRIVDIDKVKSDVNGAVGR